MILDYFMRADGIIRMGCCHCCVGTFVILLGWSLRYLIIFYLYFYVLSLCYIACGVVIWYMFEWK